MNRVLFALLSAVLLLAGCSDGSDRTQAPGTAEGTNIHKLETVLSDTTLDEFTDQLGEKGFMRVHRSYLVNLSLVTSLKSSQRQYNVFPKGVSEAIVNSNALHPGFMRSVWLILVTQALIVLRFELLAG